MTINELNRKFGLRSMAKFVEGRGGLTKLVMTHELGRCELYLHGAHVTSYVPTGGKEVLWVSRKSLFEAGAPIRGGIPVCHPWFGPLEADPEAPMHGLARTSDFEVESVESIVPDGVSAVLKRRFAKADKPGRPGNYELRVRVTVGRSLCVACETRNLGRDELPLTEALHSYFGVSDVRKVSVMHLSGVEYFCKVKGAPGVEGAKPVTFKGEFDRVYTDTTVGAKIVDPGAKREINVSKRGSNSTVVWNPWTKKAAAMADFGDNEWPRMLCIEAANALSDAVRVPRGGKHVLETVIRAVTR